MLLNVTFLTKAEFTATKSADLFQKLLPLLQSEVAINHKTLYKRLLEILSSTI